MRGAEPEDPMGIWSRFEVEVPKDEARIMRMIPFVPPEVRLFRVFTLDSPCPHPTLSVEGRHCLSTNDPSGLRRGVLV